MKILICFLSLFLVAVYGKKLPTFITPCKRDNPNLGKCMLDAFENIRGRLIEGIPEMKIPSVDPFYVEQVNLDTGGLKAAFHGMFLYGIGHINFKKVEFDISKPALTIYSEVPVVSIKANYTVKGKILLFEINGHGLGNGTYSDVKARADCIGKYVTRKGKRFIELTDDSKISVTLGGAGIYLDNLFEGNPQLTETTNKVLNDNIEVLTEQFIPVVEEVISTIVLSIVRRIFKTYSLEELFPVK